MNLATHSEYCHYSRFDMERSTSSNLSLPSTYATVSDDERRRYLDVLQARDNRLLIPTVIFLSTVAILGLFGNSLVLLVYWRKTRRTATDVFIMAIAAFDLLTNVLALPNEIYDTFHYWDFDTPSQCKFRVYVNAFTTMTSALALLAVAITRYKKICRPFGNQTSRKTAKILSILIVVVCSLCAVPQPILYGIKTRKTARPDILGHECDIADEYLDTIWPMIFAGFLMILFMIVYIPLIVLYVLVGIQAWKHSQRHGIPVIARSQSTSETTDCTADSEDVTNASMQSSQRTSFGFSLFKKKNNKYKSSHQSGGSIREELHELKLKQHLKDKEPEVTDKTHSGDNHQKRSTTETDNSAKNVKHLHSSDVEDTKSTEFLREYSSNECASEEHNTRQADECPQLKVSIQSPKVEQLPSENDEMGDKRRQDNNSTPNGGTISEAKFCEKTHLTVNGLTKSDKTGSEGIRDANKENDNVTTACRNDELVGTCKRIHEDDVEKHPEENSPTGLFAKSQNPTSKSVLQKKAHTRRVLNRTTLMLITITAVYVIAFVPYFILVSLKFSSPLFYENLSAVGESLYNVFLRFFFINSAANALIYSICDPRFRLVIVKIFKCQN